MKDYTTYDGTRTMLRCYRKVFHKGIELRVSRSCSRFIGKASKGPRRRGD